MNISRHLKDQIRNGIEVQIEEYRIKLKAMLVADIITADVWAALDKAILDAQCKAESEVEKIIENYVGEQHDYVP